MAGDLNRISSANCGAAWAQTFTYDPFANITKNASIGTNYAAFYGSQNRVIGGSKAAYDAVGDQTQSTAGNCGWNAAAQVVSASMTSGTTVQATYDAVGRVVEITSGTSEPPTPNSAISPQGTQYAVVQNGTLTRGLVPLLGGDTAVYRSTNLYSIRRTDMLGSSRLATS